MENLKITQLKKHQFKDRLALILQASFCCFLWGTGIPTVKTSYKALDISADDLFSKLVLAGMRFLLAGILIGIYLLIKQKQFPKVKTSQLKMIIIFGLLNTTLQFLFFYTGISYTGAVKAALLDALKPLLVVILAHFLTKDDKINSAKLLGLTVGIIGIIVANLENVTSGGLNIQGSFKGDGMLFFASLSFAFAVIYSKKIMSCISSTVLNMYQFIFGSIVLLVFGLIGAGGYHLHFNLKATVLLIYLALLSAASFVIWYQLIDTYGASRVSIFVFLTPVFGSIISSVIFPDEHITIYVLVSLILMSLGIYLVNKRKQ